MNKEGKGMFITVKVLVNSEGAVTRDCRCFETIAEAKVRFHSDLANAIGKETTASIMMLLVDENGLTVMREVWRAPEEEPETEIAEDEE